MGLSRPPSRWIVTLRDPGPVDRPLAVDMLIALGAFGVTLALLARGGSGSRGLDVLGGVLAALACLPLLYRRHAPLAVFALTTAASATLNGLGYAAGPPLGPTAALFFVANDDRTEARLRHTRRGALLRGCPRT